MRLLRPHHNTTATPGPDSSEYTIIYLHGHPSLPHDRAGRAGLHVMKRRFEVLPKWATWTPELERVLADDCRTYHSSYNNRFENELGLNYLASLSSCSYDGLESARHVVLKVCQGKEVVFDFACIDEEVVRQININLANANKPDAFGLSHHEKWGPAYHVWVAIYLKIFNEALKKSPDYSLVKQYRYGL